MLSLHGYQLPCREFPRELIEERKTLQLLGTHGRTRAILKLLRLPSPRHRKPRPTDFVKDVRHGFWTSEYFEKSLFEFFETLQPSQSLDLFNPTILVIQHPKNPSSMRVTSRVRRRLTSRQTSRTPIVTPSLED